MMLIVLITKSEKDHQNTHRPNTLEQMWILYEIPADQIQQHLKRSQRDQVGLIPECKVGSHTQIDVM